MSELETLKRRAAARVDELREDLVAISRALHDDPELAFEEHRSAALLCDRLEASGFAVERGAGDLPTAFSAEVRGAAGGPAIAILAEYDALPGIGHACGHNLIAAASIGAGLAVASVMGELPGRILVVGTPAEERGDGKLILESNGVFAGVDATMMVHPSAYTMVARPSLALTELTVEFLGKTAHAAAAPEAGISALEALLLTFNNINSLRLHLRPDARVHGIITHGGTASNIIPEHAAAEFSVRAAQRGYLEEVLRRVIACAEGAAASTGATLRYQTGSVLFDFVPNQTLARLFAGNWQQLGVPVHEPRPNERMGSTDYGNLSHAVPSVHPYIAIAPDGTAGHTREFREAVLSPMGQQGLIDAAKGMAMTAIDLLANPDALAKARREHAERFH